MIGRIILEISVIFIVYCLGYIMGFKACSRYVKDVIENHRNKND